MIIQDKNFWLMTKIDMRTPPYRGIVAEVAKSLGKKHSATYQAIFYSKAANEDKRVFRKLKEEREKEVQAFEDSLKKAV